MSLLDQSNNTISHKSSGVRVRYYIFTVGESRFDRSDTTDLQKTGLKLRCAVFYRVSEETGGPNPNPSPIPLPTSTQKPATSLCRLWFCGFPWTAVIATIRWYACSFARAKVVVSLNFKLNLPSFYDCQY